MSAPNAQISIASGSSDAIRVRASSEFTLSGWSSSSPSARAAVATGGGDSLRPRPFGRSGRVITSAGRQRLSANRSRTVTAKSEVPR